MSEAVLEVERRGKSLGVRLPAAITRAAELRVGQRVRVSVERGRVIVALLLAMEMSLEARLKLFDPTRHGGEVMRSRSLGDYRWSPPRPAGRVSDRRRRRSSRASLDRL